MDTFLLENTSDETAAHTDSDRIKRIHNRVCKVRTSEEIGVKYMQAWEERYYDKQEAREDGLAEGLSKGATNKLKELISKKLEKGKSIEEIADAVEESEDTIRQLIEEIENENMDLTLVKGTKNAEAKD